MITVETLNVKGLIDDKVVARENRALAMLFCHMWRVTKKKVTTWEHVWKHSIDGGKRAQPMSDWEEDVFRAKISSLQSEKPPCE